jgi:hypothetical protein
MVEELRAQRRQELVDEARQTVKVEIFDDELAQLELPAALGDPAATSPAAASDPGADTGTVVGK